jgi:hypothetical protein
MSRTARIVHLALCFVLLFALLAVVYSLNFDFVRETGFSRKVVVVLLFLPCAGLAWLAVFAVDAVVEERRTRVAPPGTRRRRRRRRSEDEFV